jgi:hypothetical protein
MTFAGTNQVARDTRLPPRRTRTVLRAKARTSQRLCKYAAVLAVSRDIPDRVVSSDPGIYSPVQLLLLATHLNAGKWILATCPSKSGSITDSPTIRSEQSLTTEPLHASVREWVRTISQSVLTRGLECSCAAPLIFVRRIASAREPLRRGLGSRWFTEWFHRNALITHFQNGQV